MRVKRRKVGPLRRVRADLEAAYRKARRHHRNQADTALRLRNATSKLLRVEIEHLAQPDLFAREARS